MVMLMDLSPDDTDQLTLFADRTRLYRLERTLDTIKDQYGSAAIVRASSFLDSGVAKERAEQIGGHYR
ncbi:DNA polymerase IV [compost metagenome]